MHVYETDSFQLAYKLQPEDSITSFAFSSGDNPSICTFSSELKDKPASLKLYPLNSLVPKTQKTFFKADSVTIQWNRNGTAVLVLTHTDSDKTGKSYYGETNLYFMQADGAFDCRVELDKPGPVHGNTFL